MKKLTLNLAAVALSFSATSAVAMDGQTDRYNEARSFPDKTIETTARVETSAR